MKVAFLSFEFEEYCIRLASALPDARVLLQTFDLAAWLDGKINGRSFAEAVQAKWLQLQQAGRPDPD